jgi:hypothetical protein
MLAIKLHHYLLLLLQRIWIILSQIKIDTVILITNEQYTIVRHDIVLAKIKKDGMVLVLLPITLIRN